MHGGGTAVCRRGGEIICWPALCFGQAVFIKSGRGRLACCLPLLGLLTAAATREECVVLCCVGWCCGDLGCVVLG